MKLTQEELEIIFAKTNGKCGYKGCDRTFNLEIHHLMTKGSGGSDSPSNLVYLCRDHHTALPVSAHRNNATLKSLKEAYITNMEDAKVTKEGRKKRKLERKTINKAKADNDKKIRKKLKEEFKKKNNGLSYQQVLYRKLKGEKK